MADDDIDRELRKIKRKQRQKSIAQKVIGPLKRAGGWTRSKLTGSRKNSSEVRRGGRSRTSSTRTSSSRRSHPFFNEYRRYSYLLVGIITVIYGYFGIGKSEAGFSGMLSNPEILLKHITVLITGLLVIFYLLNVIYLVLGALNLVGRSTARTVNRNRRVVLGLLGASALGSSGWLFRHNDGDLGETVEDVQDIPERLSTGGVNSEGTKTFAASENFERVSWDVSLGSVKLVVDLKEDHSMDWFRIRAGNVLPETEVAKRRAPSEGTRVEIDMLDAFARTELPSGRWRLEAFEGPQTDDAEKLGYVVWEVAPNLNFEGVPTITQPGRGVEIDVTNTGNAPALVKRMTVSEYEPVPVGGFTLIAPGTTQRVNSVGTPFRDNCMPESYTLSVDGTPDSGASIDISSEMGEDC